MRKKTLAGVCTLMTIIIVIGLGFLGVRIPLAVSALVIVVLGPLLMLPLTLLNTKLLAWRKANGRDIEEEEKYEMSDIDIISLKPQEKRESDDRYSMRFR